MRPRQPPQRITSYLRGLIDAGVEPIKAQYLVDAATTTWDGRVFDDLDPLGEDCKYSPVKGLVHKYNNRVLWKVSYRCAAHCRFCTRIRQIGSVDGDLSDNDIQTALAYIKDHPHVDDVILSGGDPLYTPRVTTRIIEQLSSVDTVKVIRIGTRLPIHSPSSFAAPQLRGLLELVSRIVTTKAIYVQIQFNHPAELTEDTRCVIRQLRSTGAVLLSQTVFLRDVNDNAGILTALFRELFYLSVVPYYIYRCDYVKGLERFVCDFEKERTIMTDITKTLSGIAVPTFIIDVPGRGKIPVPLRFWTNVAAGLCGDFDGKALALMETLQPDARGQQWSPD